MAQFFIRTTVLLVALASLAVPAYLWATRPAYLHSLDVLDTVAPMENPLSYEGVVLSPEELLRNDAELEELKAFLASHPDEEEE